MATAAKRHNRVCEQCGKPFYGSGRQYRCSWTCRQAAQARPYEPEPEPARPVRSLADAIRLVEAQIGDRKNRDTSLLLLELDILRSLATHP